MRKVRRAIIFVLFLLAASCAAPRLDRFPELYWPSPPERPRVKFVDLYVGSLDVTGIRKSKLKSVIFGEQGDIGFFKPSFIGVRHNVLFITDVDRVHVYDFNERKYGQIGLGTLKTATGIAVGNDMTVYVADSSRRRVFVFKHGASRITTIGDVGDFISPGGVAVDDVNGRVIVADAKKHMVFVFDLEGKKLFEIGRRGPEEGEFNFPYDVAVDGDGNIYVLDSGNFRVQIFDKAGNFINKFGAVGSEPGFFARPKGITLDSSGLIYVVDAAFGNYQIFDRDGKLYLSVGSTGVEAGKFNLPMGIDIDEKDRVFVVDQINKRVQVFQLIKYPEDKEAVPKG